MKQQLEQNEKMHIATYLLREITVFHSALDLLENWAHCAVISRIAG